MSQGSDGGRSIREKILLAAAEASGNDPMAEFTAEALIVKAWELDPESFGLRGYEKSHPDSNRIFTKLDGKVGLIAQGFLAKAGERKYRITPTGVARAVALGDDPSGADQQKLERLLQTKLTELLEHPAFLDWIRSPEKPLKFRNAGHFWGIAPGTPSEVVREQVGGVDRLLDLGEAALAKSGSARIVRSHGKALFDSEDLERIRGFQKTLKEQFRRELLSMDPDGKY